MKNQVIDKRILGGAKRQSRALVVLTMMLALVMNAEGQPKQVIEFQTVMSMHETTYKNFIRGGIPEQICLFLVGLTEGCTW